jgi:hypothetical protein
MNLALLAYEMRAAGIKSLALELSESPGSLPTAHIERDTLAPGEPSEPDAPPKDPKLCVAAGCSSERGGLFGGSAAGEYCREHALAKAGVKR